MLEPKSGTAETAIISDPRKNTVKSNEETVKNGSCYINIIISQLHNFGKCLITQLTKYLHNNGMSIKQPLLSVMRGSCSFFIRWL